MINELQVAFALTVIVGDMIGIYLIITKGDKK